MKQILGGHSALLLFRSTVRLLDVFLWRLGTQRCFARVNLIHVPVWRLDVQIAADLETLVWLLNSDTGRDPTAHFIPIRQPGHICKGHRLTQQTDQRGFVGPERSTRRREDCQDGRREAGA